VPGRWLLLVVLLAAGCNPSASPSASAEGDGVAGGTLRAALWVYEDATLEEHEQKLLDPQLWYWHPFARCCLLRTLLSYEGRSIEDGGAQLKPDLAETMPEVSADGMTWTFRLREGLRYAPPFDEREIVARDIITALERTVRVGESPYQDVIQGVQAYRDGDAGTISGVQAPDDRTIVFQLTEPAGDFGNRVAMPYLAPIPEEAIEFHDEDYGGFLVASGPYMIEGAEALDHADPDSAPTIEAENLVLVRNPSWSPELDPIRPAYVDRIEVVPMPERDAGVVDPHLRSTIDLTLDPMTATARGEVVADSELRGRLREVAYPTLFFIPLNLAQPPFDDVAVRRAVNTIIDRPALVGAFHPERGSSLLPVAHVFPEVAVAGLLQEYVPSGIGTGTGDPDSAHELMAESAYDADGDGRCDGDACSVIGNRFGATTDQQIETVTANLADLGIEVTWVDEPLMDDPTAHVAIAALFGWTADYPSANDFEALLSSPTAPGLNFSLLGAAADQLAEWGYEVTDVASVDDKIAICQSRGGSAAFACWAELDQILSEQIVAWIPVASQIGAHIISDRVDRFEFSGAEAMPALDRISLYPQGDQ